MAQEPDVELVLPARRFPDFLTHIGCTSQVISDEMMAQITQSLVCRDSDIEMGSYMRFGDFIQWYRQHGVAFLFSLFDFDGNGVLTVEELPELLRCIGIDVGDNQVRSVLKLLDCDSSGSITLVELQQWWTVFDAQQAFEVSDRAPPPDPRIHVTYTIADSCVLRLCSFTTSPTTVPSTIASCGCWRGSSASR